MHMLRKIVNSALRIDKAGLLGAFGAKSNEFHRLVLMGC
jgi:hypothetical protein